MANCIHLRCEPYESCQLDYIFVNVTEPNFGTDVGMTLLQTHGPADCAGQVCCIHHPSGHHMVTWPQKWRTERHRMERTCEHDYDHPDPDDLNPITEHRCDGCCRKPEETS